MTNNKKGIIENGWFSEKNEMWPGISLSIEVEKVLYQNKTYFQEILVFDSKTFGRVLALDGVIQLTTRDEVAYHEMLAHIPMFLSYNPENILIIGGGDGGIIREVLKHKQVQNVTLCEIDSGVIDISKKYFPEISSSFENKKAQVVIGDGKKYLTEQLNKFDVIIVDSSDPIGPANSLYGEEFYNLVKSKLSNSGILAIQGESLFLHKDFARKLKKMLDSMFKFSGYSQVHVPTYPGGNIGLLVCSNFRKVDTPIKKVPKEIGQSLKYYSEKVHIASFVLPQNYEI